MGEHKRYKKDTLQYCHFAPEWPKLPANTGKIRKIKTIDGQIRHFKIEDEIIQPQIGSDRKIIVLQKMRYLEQNEIEFRFVYYMIGLKAGARGRWVWGQLCLLIPQQDLLLLLKEAKRKGWFTSKRGKK